MKQKQLSGIRKEQLLQKCEALMLQNIDSPAEISRSLKIAYNTAISYAEIVKSRWAKNSNIDELQAKRQELIRKTEQIIKEAWLLKNKAKNGLEAVGALRTALIAIERQQKLLGLDALPLPEEKPMQMIISEFANEVNSLPPEQKQQILARLKQRREELMLTETDNQSSRLNSSYS